MDPLTLTALIMAIGSLITSCLTHIKHSSCLNHCIDIDTYSPEEEHKNINKI